MLTNVNLRMNVKHCMVTCVLTPLGVILAIAEQLDFNLVILDTVVKASLLRKIFFAC